MNTNRRSFLETLGGLAIGSAATTLFDHEIMTEIKNLLAERQTLSPSELAEDETFWFQIQRAYRQSAQFINLENGYFSPQPETVMAAQLDYIKMINEMPSYYMRTRQFEEYDQVKKQLAEFAGCSTEEIAITRNTTESMNTVIMGMDFQAGDEVVLCDQDYMSMQEQFQQQGKRHGLKLTYIELPLDPKSDAEIVERYEKAITPKTKVILVTHLINITGQILPVRAIADMAHRHGVQVIVDGAHAFAQIEFKIPDLGADYYGASLHKWLCCPLGAGILYVKKEHIPGIWPLYGDTGFPDDNIKKLEHVGTRPVSTPLTIANAIQFHNLIGSARKEARLRYLQNYWVDKVRHFPKVMINTPKEKHRSC
ncbi:MAG: aminotransferase class V-fold PLP-dependent enzyme, partial [Bacteroidetes bacterium]|nr:aminotransferase class V-fold PLP-dependent enzyme [Bacteroidota bacterium]